MSNLTRRKFLATVPTAGVAAGIALAGGAAPAARTQAVPQGGLLGRPSYLTIKRDPNGAEPGGLVLKISGLTVTRVKRQAQTARTYFLDMERVGVPKHFPHLIIDKRGIVSGSSAPDAVTRNFAIYTLSGACTIDGPSEPLTFNMGPQAVVRTCAEASRGLNSFLQPRQGLGLAYTPVSDEMMEQRSVAWFDYPRGRFEDAADYGVGDPSDEPLLIGSGLEALKPGDTTYPQQVINQVLYFGVPALEEIRFSMPGRSVVVDGRRNQIIAGLVHLPLHEHFDVQLPAKLDDFTVLRLIMGDQSAHRPVVNVNDCKTQQHNGCSCCDPIVEIL